MYAEEYAKQELIINTICFSTIHKNKIALFKRIKGRFNTDKNLLS